MKPTLASPTSPIHNFELQEKEIKQIKPQAYTKIVEDYLKSQENSPKSGGLPDVFKSETIFTRDPEFQISK